MNQNLKKILISSGAVITIAGSAVVGSQINGVSCDYLIPIDEEHEICFSEEQYQAAQREFGIKLNEAINGRPLTEIKLNELL